MTTFELAPKGKKCPRYGGRLELEHNKDGAVTGGRIVPYDCRELVIDGTCQETWMHIAGTNPLTGEAVNKWDCAFRVGWLFAANAERKAHEAAADVCNLRNMIFDADYRQRELERAYIETPKAIEAP